LSLPRLAAVLLVDQRHRWQPGTCRCSSCWGWR
jgi:hypothetical protein